MKSKWEWKLLKTGLKVYGFRSYKKYLKSEYWERTKKRYLESNRPKVCVGCGSEKFQIHHRTYERLGYEKMTDLIALCGRCHTKVHKWIKFSKSKDFEVSLLNSILYEAEKRRVKEF